jgi:predicted amidohydrolase YtcJ
VTDVRASLGVWKLFTAPKIRVGTPGDAGRADAMVVFGERVVAVGARDELKAAYRFDDVIELGGVVLPGFNDAHIHPTMTAENLLHVDCSPEAVPDGAELSRRLRAEAQRPEVEWVLGSRYDQSKSTGGQVVDRRFLDEAAGAKPALLIHVAAHWGVLNSAGLAAAGLSAHSEDPPGGALGRDADGELTGLVFEQALFDIAYPSLARGGVALLEPSSDEARLRGLRRALDLFHAAGLTSVCDALCGPDDLRLLSEARARGELTMRTGVLMSYPNLDALRDVAVTSGLGDDRLRLVGLKAFVDGACAGGNCWVDEPFEGTDDHGMAVVGAEDLNDLVRESRSAGIALATHANGDRAIRMVLDAHEAFADVGPSRLRHRIEHCTLVDRDIVARIKDLDLTVVPFGSYARFHADKLLGLYGPERLNRMFAHRWLLDAGVAVAGSSDYPCGPLEPLAALASCVGRIALDGTPMGLDQRITMAEAVALYTTGSAYATGEENIKGTLNPGMLADFVELSADPFEVDVDEVPDIAVRSTWVGAEPVFVAQAGDN